MKHVWQIFGCIILAVAAGAMAAGCRESVPDKVDITLRFDHLKNRSAAFDVKPDPSISEFIIRGEGPHNASFETSTSSDRIIVEDIYVGEWTFTAEGLNTEETVLLYGKTQQQLIPGNPDIFIDLYPSEGYGHVEITVTWEEQGSDPLYGRVVCRRTDISDSEPGTFPLTTSNTQGLLSRELAAGDYSMKIEIYHDLELAQKLGSLITTARVFKDSVTFGTINLDTELPLSSRGINFRDHSGIPLHGEITGAPFIIYENVPMELTYLPDNPDAAAQDDLVLEWYINGQIVRTHEDSLETQITPEAGYQRMDVLAYSSRPGSLGSAVMEFVALDYELTEDLMLIQTLLDDDEDIYLRSVYDITAVPQGYVIAASRGNSLIQIFSQEADGTLLPHQIIEDSPSTPLRGARALSASSDGSILCVLSEYSPSLGIYEYSPALEKYVHRHTLTDELAPGVPLELPSRAVIAGNNRDVYITDQLTDELHHLHWDSEHLSYQGTAHVSGSPGLSSPRRMSIDPTGKYLALASMNNSSLHLFSLDHTGAPAPVQSFSYSHTGTMGISQINHLAFADDSTLYTASNDFICHFGYDQEGEFYNSYRIHERDFQDCSMSGLRCVAVDEFRDQIYIGNVTSRGVTAFARNPDNTLDFLSFTPCAPLHHLTIGPSGYYLYAISSSEHALFVFDLR